MGNKVLKKGLAVLLLFAILISQMNFVDAATEENETAVETTTGGTAATEESTTVETAKTTLEESTTAAAESTTAVAESTTSAATKEESISEETTTEESATEKTTDKSAITYDPQPKTMEEVQVAIDDYTSKYQEVLESEGVLEAIKIKKPHWEYEVDSSLMPSGYQCQQVTEEDDKDFGASYYTFFAKPNALAGTPIDVSNFADFKSAVEAGQEVNLLNSITATGHVGSTSSYINYDIIIHGNDFTLDMKNYQFMLTGTHNLSIDKLVLEQSSSTSDNEVLYGLFDIRSGTESSSYVWNAYFNNVTFNGTALLGTHNLDSSANGVNRKFDTVNFEDVTINVGGGYRARNAVVFAENINIAGTFEMHSAAVASSIYGYTHPTYQRYFKSPGTGHVGSEHQSSISTAAFGTFAVKTDAKVNITRDPGYGTYPWQSVSANDTLYYRSLIVNYANYIFETGSEFYAKAGTNRNVYSYGAANESANVQERNAVIRSNNASSFQVLAGAAVTLETDYQNTFTATNTGTAAAQNCKGFTALSLRKTNDLNINIAGTLNLIGGNLGSAAGTSIDARTTAPILIWGQGASTTTVTGTLNVQSDTPNAWCYEYRTGTGTGVSGSAATGKQTFIVDGSNAVANIIGNNEGKQRGNEYAAFEAYGTYDMDIQVLNGATMTVKSNGYRGMSLASAGTYKNKTITVDGDGSILDISGIHWAIAAEGQPVLKINATDGGVINLGTYGQVNDGYAASGSDPSTVYSVGPTTYTVSGTGSEINVYHRGGTYGAIFHDGYGALVIDVNSGGAMNVESYNSGTNIDARRAAVTVQNPGAGSQGDLDGSIIKVDGEDSSFTVRCHNTDLHSGTYGVQQFSMGAISMGGYENLGGGSIEVTKGASFYAISDSLAPTIFLNSGKITFDDPKAYEIRNNATHDTTTTYNNQNKNPYSAYFEDYATVGQAIYIARAGGTLLQNLSSTDNVLLFNNCDVTVWKVDKNHSDYSGGGYVDSQIDTYWNDVGISASISSIANASSLGRIVTPTSNVLNKWTTNTEFTDTDGINYTTEFILPAYGRIMGSGSSYADRNTNLLLDKSVDSDKVEVGEEFTYTISVSNNWLENIENNGSEIITSNTVWTNVILEDKLDYRLDYVSCSDPGVNVVATPDKDENGNDITILTITIAEVKASEVFKVNLNVKANEYASGGAMLANTVTVSGLEDLIWAEVTGPEVIASALPAAVKTSDRIDLDNDGVTDTYVGDTVTYSIAAKNIDEADVPTGSNKDDFVWSGVTIHDTLPTGLKLIENSVKIGEYVVPKDTAVGSNPYYYTYNESTREFIVYLGDIAVGEAVTVTFQVKVGKEAVETPDEDNIRNTGTADGTYRETLYTTDFDDNNIDPVIGVIYKVTYDKNDTIGDALATGNVPVDSNEYYYDDLVTVIGNTGNLAKENYEFTGWNTKADGSGDTYIEDDTFQITEDTILYAQWKSTLVSFDFKKVTADGDNAPLKGAEFQLYLWTGAGEAPEIVENASIDENKWVLVDTQKSGIDGNVSFEGLSKDSIYQLVETKAPAGYKRPVGQWRITVSSSGEILPQAKGDMVPPAFYTDSDGLALPNMKDKSFPFTGFDGITGFLFIGLSIMAITVVFLLFSKRRKVNIKDFLFNTGLKGGKE